MTISKQTSKILLDFDINIRNMKNDLPICDMFAKLNLKNLIYITLKLLIFFQTRDNFNYNSLHAKSQIHFYLQPFAFIDITLSLTAAASKKRPSDLQVQGSSSLCPAHCVSKLLLYFLTSSKTCC